MTDTLPEEIGTLEGRQMLDDAARLHLNLTGEEFLRAYRAGELTCRDHLGVEQVAALIPFACSLPSPPDDGTFMGWMSFDVEEAP